MGILILSHAEILSLNRAERKRVCVRVVSMWEEAHASQEGGEGGKGGGGQ